MASSIFQNLCNVMFFQLGRCFSGVPKNCQLSRLEPYPRFTKNCYIIFFCCTSFIANKLYDSDLFFSSCTYYNDWFLSADSQNFLMKYYFSSAAYQDNLQPSKSINVSRDSVEPQGCRIKDCTGAHTPIHPYNILRNHKLCPPIFSTNLRSK